MSDAEVSELATRAKTVAAVEMVIVVRVLKDMVSDLSWWVEWSRWKTRTSTSDHQHDSHTQSLGLLMHGLLLVVSADRAEPRMAEMLKSIQAHLY